MCLWRIIQYTSYKSVRSLGGKMPGSGLLWFGLVWCISVCVGVCMYLLMCGCVYVSAYVSVCVCVCVCVCGLVGQKLFCIVLFVLDPE